MSTKLSYMAKTLLYKRGRTVVSKYIETKFELNFELTFSN